MGFGREPGQFVWSHVLKHHLFCSTAQADPEAHDQIKQWSRKAGRDAVLNRQFTRHTVLEKNLQLEENQGEIVGIEHLGGLRESYHGKAA